MFLKISENSQENNTCAFNLNTLAQVFSCEFSEIFKNTFFCRTPLVSASVSIHLSALKTKFIITDIIHNNLDIITVLLFILILHGNNSMLDVGIFLTHFSDTYCRFKTYLIKLFHQQRECYFFKKLVLKIYQIWILKFIIINYNCKCYLIFVLDPFEPHFLFLYSRTPENVRFLGVKKMNIELKQVNEIGSLFYIISNMALICYFTLAQATLRHWQC